MPNAGVLLLTKEQGEDEVVVRKSSSHHLLCSPIIFIVQRGYGAHSPQKAWPLRTQALPNPHPR
jgi:hypothetical protein